MSQVPARDLEAVFSDSGELSENIVFYDADGAEAETVKGFIETDGAPVLETDANIITVSVITATAPSIARGRYVQCGAFFTP